MKKLLIGLLIVAAGAGAFLLLRKKKNTSTTINRDWIIGQWTPLVFSPDTLALQDSNFTKYRFDFRKDGNVIRTLNDSVKADTSRYVWSREGELVWAGWKPRVTGDSTVAAFSITKLTKDSLQIRAADSSAVLFIKTN